MSSKEPKELSNEVRMLIAFGVMGAILFATPWVYRKMGYSIDEPTKASGASGTSAAQKTSAPKPGALEVPADTSKPTELTAPTSAASAETFTIDTALAHVVFSNEGAVVKSFTFKKFVDEAGKPLEVVNLAGAAKTGYPFGLEFRGVVPTANLNKVLWSGSPRGDGLSIEFDCSDGHTAAKKVFSFAPNSYQFQVATEVNRDGNGLQHEVSWRGGFGDLAVNNAPSRQGMIRYDLANHKLVRDAAKAAKDGPRRADGSFSFAGVEDQYFTAVFLPPQDQNTRTTLFYDSVITPFDKSEQAYPGVAVGGQTRNQMAVYVGPKEVSTLETVNSRLADVIDWGWFGVIAKPLFWMLKFLNNGYVKNYGWSIILLTIFINIALFPLKMVNMRSMKKMQKLTPEMNRINEKYKGIPMSDPRAQKKQQEIMDLYKKHSVNPLGGCIPMLIQLPFLYAFYKVLSVTVEMRHAGWLWIGDLSQPEHFAIRVLPLVMVISSVVLQRMTPQPAGGDPSQQKVMQFMPVMMGVLFWPASSGLVLYWLTSNLVGLLQQWFFNKTGSASVPEVAIASKGRKG